jgi:mgtE-like transporter
VLHRPRLVRRFRALVRADPAGVRAGFVAHLIAAATGLVAGVTLGSITGTLEQLPGLLVVVPAAVGLRGNIFGALGSRLGTSVATGTFRLSRRRGTIVGQNLLVAAGLSLSMSFLIALIAKGAALAFGVEHAIGVGDFVVVSVIGGLLPTAVVMAITIGAAAVCVRRNWDLDNVAAPIVTAAGDSVTLPSIFLAALIVRDAPHDFVSVVAVMCAIVGVAALVSGWRARLPIVHRVTRESVPVLVAAGCLSILAGQTIQSRLGPLVASPALLIVVPPLLSLSGSLAGILSARVATKLHIGLLDPARLDPRVVAEDVAVVYAIAVPIFVLLAVVADGLAAVLGLASPGMFEMLELVLLAGVVATAHSCVVAFYGGFSTYRLGLDPDNFGVPMVSSSSDFLGAVSLILALVILGLS